MKIISQPDFESVSAHAADAIVAAVLGGARTLLVATGRSPMRVYELLADAQREGRFSTEDLTVVQLDEYWGLTEHDDRRLSRWMTHAIVEPWQLQDRQVVRFDTAMTDAQMACDRLKDEIDRVGGLDLAILGLGPNGHLGFNEPPSSPSSTTRPIALTAESVASNASYWGGAERTPRHAVTVGLDAIMNTRQVLLVVSGEHKRAILRRALVAAPSPDVPASYLQLHPQVSVFADHPALPTTSVEMA